MDDFRVGSISPYDPVHRQGGEDGESRKRKRQAASADQDTEDVVSLSEPEEGAEDLGTSYSPPGAGSSKD